MFTFDAKIKHAVFLLKRIVDKALASDMEPLFPVEEEIQMEDDIAEDPDRLLTRLPHGIPTANEYYHLNLPGLVEGVGGEKLQSPSITQLYHILFYRLSAELILRDYSFFTGSHTNRRSEFFLYLSTIQLLFVKQWSFDELNDPALEAHTQVSSLPIPSLRLQEIVKEIDKSMSLQAVQNLQKIRKGKWFGRWKMPVFFRIGIQKKCWNT